jgi:hypothetical protein
MFCLSCRSLLKNGADPTITTRSGRSVLDINEGPVIQQKLSKVLERTKGGKMTEGKKSQRVQAIITAHAFIIHEIPSSSVVSSLSSTALDFLLKIS